MPDRRSSTPLVGVLACVLAGTAAAGEIPQFRTRDVRFYEGGLDAPPHTQLGVVFVNRRDSKRFSSLTWRAIYDSVTTQSIALGGDLVVHVRVGEGGDPRDQHGAAKWILGIAGRSKNLASEGLRDCDNCIVEWSGLDASGAGIPDTAEVARLDLQAFQISRLRLGELGYYLVERRASDPFEIEAADPTERELQPTLALGLATSRVPRSEGDAAHVVSFTARLTWSISGGTAWRRAFSWASGGDRFDYLSGADGLATRTALLNLYGTLAPRGATPDSDGDGVPDSRDEEFDTPPGVNVTSAGARDDDLDGIKNTADRHPGTRRGQMVNSHGVPIRDADHDGVDDPYDKCPGTDPDLIADDTGCPIEVTEIIDKLLDVGVFLEHVHFATDAATIMESSFGRLDAIGTALSDLPELRFVIHGHCDDRGTDEHNQTLSEARARSVVEYLAHGFPGIDRRQLTALGHGKSMPLEAGRDEESRARNRRVEFELLNREAAKQQVERKRFLKRGLALPDSLAVGPAATR